jgi:rare lipoprotein A (peptidoglycan hydrolase)
MKRLSATTAALTASVLAAAVALPAAASTGTSNGGASASPPADQQSQGTTDPRASSADYKAVKATWYGPGLYGHRLACGGRLHQATVGVAHRNLPCGTKVALRYKGHTIVVPVIDRGPYARGVTYDLTEATAQQLGMTQTSRLRAAALGR